MNDSDVIAAFVPDLWDDSWQSRHHVLEGLSKYFKVLWLSPPLYWESCLRGGLRKNVSQRGIKRISDDFWAYAPVLPADYKAKYVRRGLVPWCFHRYHDLWKKRYISKVGRLLRRMGAGRVILYIWRPEYAEYVGRFGEAVACYHIDDEYTFDPSGQMPMSEEEENLLRRSDLVFIHSRSMLEKKGRINPNTHYIPNGVNFDAFRRVMETETSEPNILRNVTSPRIVYIGYVKRHLDFPLILDMARARRDRSIVIVGPVRQEHSDIADDIERLRKEANVHFLGGVPHDQIPAILKWCDVCILPYRRTEYTKHIYPLKLHEYLACGKPVIATSLDNLREFSDVLRFADGSDEWTAAIEHALENSDETLVDRMISVARENAWPSRVQAIASLFEESLRIRR